MHLTYTNFKNSAARFFKIMGPVILSALSLFVCFHVLQPLALWLDPSFSLLANRGVGKVVFTLLVLLHIMLLLTTTSQQFTRSFLQTNLLFMRTDKWVKPFSTYFIIFFSLHSFLLIGLSVATDFVQYTPHILNLVPFKIGPLLWGFVATFFLAWTEETIFRGTLYPFLHQKLSERSSIFMASFIFMLAHNLTNPLLLITDNWKLGLGLFLLGMLLNIIFAITGKLYIGMGIHAGLVFVKVFLRRIPCITYATTLPWWFDIDLRQSFVIHIIFICIIFILLYTMHCKKRNKR